MQRVGRDQIYLQLNALTPTYQPSNVMSLQFATVISPKQPVSDSDAETIRATESCAMLSKAIFTLWDPHVVLITLFVNIFS